LRLFFEESRRYARLHHLKARVVEQYDIDALSAQTLLRATDGAFEELDVKTLTRRLGVQRGANFGHHYRPGFGQSCA
jgi:hypothetical protein